MACLFAHLTREVLLSNIFEYYLTLFVCNLKQIDCRPTPENLKRNAKLKDTTYFATVQLNRKLGTMTWDNGANLSPSFLYSVIIEKAA